MHYIYARRLESSTIGRPNLFLEIIRTFSVQAGELWARFILNFSSSPSLRFPSRRIFSSISRDVFTIGLTEITKIREQWKERKKNARLFSFRGTMKYRVSERIKRRNPSVIFPLTARGREIGAGDSLGGREQAWTQVAETFLMLENMPFMCHWPLYALVPCQWVRVPDSTTKIERLPLRRVYLFATSISSWTSRKWKQMFGKRRSDWISTRYHERFNLPIVYPIKGSILQIC